MPYIPDDEREVIHNLLAPVGTVLDAAGNQTGHLNYAITALLDGHLMNKGVNYASIAEAISAAEEAAHELRRRVLVPYEDRKRLESTGPP